MVHFSQFSIFAAFFLFSSSAAFSQPTRTVERNLPIRIYKKGSSKPIVFKDDKDYKLRVEYNYSEKAEAERAGVSFLFNLRFEDTIVTTDYPFPFSVSHQDERMYVRRMLDDFNPADAPVLNVPFQDGSYVVPNAYAPLFSGEGFMPWLTIKNRDISNFKVDDVSQFPNLPQTKLLPTDLPPDYLYKQMLPIKNGKAKVAFLAKDPNGKHKIVIGNTKVWSVIDLPSKIERQEIGKIYVKSDKAYIVFLANAKQGEPNIWRTSDAGKNWKADKASAKIHFQDLHFFDGTNGIGIAKVNSGESGGKETATMVGFYRTENNGGTWSLEGLLPAPIHLLNCPSSDTLYVGNWHWDEERTYFVSYDGGKDWKPVVVPTKNPDFAVDTQCKNRPEMGESWMMSQKGEFYYSPPTGSYHWYRAAFNGQLGVIVGKRFYLQSFDKGKTWAFVPLNMPQDPKVSVYGGLYPNVVFVEKNKAMISAYGRVYLVSITE